MTDLLQEELTGAPVTVTIAGVEYPLTYTMAAVILYKQKTSDSLFLAESFTRIDLGADPERWLFCLWAGLHKRDAKGEWRSPLTLEALQEKIDFSNAAEISIAMAKALTSSMPKPRKEDTSPNAAAPGELAQPPAIVANPPKIKNAELIGSTPALVDASNSLETSS
jgi:hypothetical protein